MNVVGKVGSLITQGVYSVATPFHPFGGAVDIIVVQQQDGSFRSTPWYVQFGKFQGVLKGAEKMVRINVNGVEANFHMYLDNSGEAYFIREADSGQDGETTNRVPKDEREGVVLEHSFSVDNSQCNVNKDNVANYRLQSTLSDPGILRDDYSSFRSDRLERSDSDACRFYDFQDDQSYEGSVDLSSEFGSSRFDNIDAVENFVEAQGSDSEMVLVSVDGHILTAPISSSEQNTENVQLGTPQFHLGPGESNGFSERDRGFMVSENVWGSDYIGNVDASSSKADSLDASWESNNIHADRSPPGNSKHKEDAIEGQGTDSMHQLEVCRDEEHSDVQEEDEGHSACQVNKKSDNQDEVSQSNHDLRPNNEDWEQVSGDRVIENEAGEEHKQFSHQIQELDDVKNQGNPCVSSDVEDASPGTKNDDKFKSCLDLTIAAVGETCESEESSLEDPEEAKALEKKRIQNVQASDKADIKFVPERTYPGAEAVASAHSGGVVKVKSYDSSGSASDCITSSSFSTPVSSQAAETVHTSMETISVESASMEKNFAHDDENTNVKPSDDYAKSNSEEFSEIESSRSEIFELHTKSLSEQNPTNLSSTFEISLCRHLLRPGMGSSAADEAFNTHRLSEKDLECTAISVVKNENLVIRYREKYLPWDKAAPIVLGKAVFGLELPIDPKDALPVEEEQTQKPGYIDSGSASGRRWRLWPIPFRRVKTLQHSNSNASEEVFVDSESFSQNLSIEQTPTSQTGTPRSEMGTKSIHKKIVRTNIPTNEQIASLNLKEGQNDVTFSFSTRVLGLQQVEAHIYLWKWNARIVISDVDGTITKSDVLGQFMPLVGKDWSQSGVARLFSAIKENGYQLLFLSARAIVQAYLTKSFLFNLKQDGKTLPTGPVVISPDGLFPSLFREVIRRAPHEFKIACLEDIKALFPPDYNPFYAGFGNRDTDELTYRKIGIPKGKIFIINPKGEVAINHRIDVKSYTSLHTLVNDMFPPTSMVEQEDYNSWNYWKMPLAEIDD